MYEELVTALLETRERVRSNPGVAMYVPPYQLSAAADAIEELSTQIKNWEDALKTALNFIPCWVPVTERLPDEKQAEDVLCWIMGRDPKAEGYCVSGCYNTLTKSWRLDADWADPWKITHWMPAPQGPKPAEDTNAPDTYDILYEEGEI